MWHAEIAIRNSSSGLCLSIVRYVPFGVSSPGRPELIGQSPKSFRSRSIPASFSPWMSLL